MRYSRTPPLPSPPLSPRCILSESVLQFAPLSCTKITLTTPLYKVGEQLSRKPLAHTTSLLQTNPRGYPVPKKETPQVPCQAQHRLLLLPTQQPTYAPAKLSLSSTLQRPTTVCIVITAILLLGRQSSSFMWWTRFPIFMLLLHGVSRRPFRRWQCACSPRQRTLWCGGRGGGRAGGQR